VKTRGDVNVHPTAEIRSDVEQVSMIALEGGSIEIEEGVFVNNGVWIRSAASVSIGAWSKIGPRVMIMDSDSHDTAPGHGPASGAKPVVIEEDVWIGAGAIILKGVRIGKHSVVGAGSVVTRDVPASTIVAGNPARVLRQV